jgi:hypothetical protein
MIENYNSEEKTKMFILTFQLFYNEQVGMIAEWYFFMLTTLDAHTIDLEDFKVKNDKEIRFALLLR